MAVTRVPMYICDNCEKRGVDANCSYRFPYGWVSEVYRVNTHTGMGHKLVRSKSMHFCSFECRRQWREEHKEWTQ
jgi:hypothetical protein